MSDYFEDPPEPTEEEMNQHEARLAVKRAPGVAITGLTAEAVQAIVESAIESNYQLQKKAEKAVGDAVVKAIEESLKRLTDEQLRPAIAAVIASGWQKTDHYGHPNGPPQSLSQRITEYLFGGGSYDKPIERAFNAELDRQLKTEAGKAFTEALASLRGKVDAELNGRITNALRQALGLR